MSNLLSSVSYSFTVNNCQTPIYGCTDSTSSNYDPLANTDDGSCCVDGCTDPLAFNYDSLATCDDGSCVPFVYGCTDPNAINYYPGANTDDGSCIYPDLDTQMVALNEGWSLFSTYIDPVNDSMSVVFQDIIDQNIYIFTPQLISKGCNAFVVSDV